MPKKPEKILIFDFDFTIADSLDSIIIFYNQIAPFLKLKEVSKKDLEKFRYLEIREAMKELNVKIWQFWFLIPYIKYRLFFEKNAFKAIIGVKQMLADLKKEGYKIGILSSNSKANILKFLIKEDLNCFDFIETERDLFGKHKAMRRFLKSRKIDHSEVIYVGDELRDINAMRKLEIPIISTSWGITAKEILEKYNPDLVVDTPEEFKTKLKDLEIIL
jgi:phosphoglycolate phosphatase